MTWVRYDDKFYDHPKVVRIAPKLMLQAVGLHVLACCWASSQLTDGFVPAHQVKRLVGGPVTKIVAELVRVGLWEESESGYQIHDYLDYQPSREHVLAERAHISEVRSKAGKRGMASRWQDRDKPDSKRDNKAGNKQPAEEKQTDNPVPVPGPDNTLLTEECAPQGFQDVDFEEPGPPEEPKPPAQEATRGKEPSPNGASPWVAHYVEALEAQGRPRPSRSQLDIFGAKVKEIRNLDPDLMAYTIARMIERGKGPPLLALIYEDCRREGEEEIFRMQVGGARRVR